jgi:hypothetical protein
MLWEDVGSTSFGNGLKQVESVPIDEFPTIWNGNRFCRTNSSNVLLIFCKVAPKEIFSNLLLRTLASEYILEIM